MSLIATDDSGFHEVPRTPSLRLSSKRRSEGSSVDGEVPRSSSNHSASSVLNGGQSSGIISTESDWTSSHDDSNVQGVPFTPATSEISFRIASPSIADRSVPQQTPDIGRRNRLVLKCHKNLSNSDRRRLIETIWLPRITTSERFAEQAHYINTFMISPQTTCRGSGDADNTNKLFDDDDDIFADSITDGNSACDVLNDPSSLPCTSGAHRNLFTRRQCASKNDISFGTTSAKNNVQTLCFDNQNRVRPSALTEEVSSPSAGPTRQMTFFWQPRRGDADNTIKQVFDDDHDDIFG